MDERELLRRAMVLNARRIDRHKRAKLPSIGGGERGLVYAIKHRGKGKFDVKPRHFDDLEEMLLRYDADFFSLELFDAAALKGGGLLITAISEFAAANLLDYGEVEMLIKGAGGMGMNELCAMNAFLRRACLKEAAKSISLLKKGDNARVEFADERLRELIRLEKSYENHDFTRISRAKSLMENAGLLERMDEDSAHRCVEEFAKISAKSPMDDEKCAKRLIEIREKCKDEPIDTFLFGKRRGEFHRRIGVRTKSAHPWAFFRLILVVLPVAAGVVLSMLFDDVVTRSFFACLLYVCAAYALIAYFSDKCSFDGFDRAPCSAREFTREGTFIIPQGCEINDAGKRRLWGIKALHDCGNVRTWPKIKEDDYAGMLISGADDRALFFEKMGICVDECGLFSQEGEGDLTDSCRTVSERAAKSMGEIFVSEWEKVKRRICQKASTRDEALYKLSGILCAAYAPCALFLILFSCFYPWQDALLLSLCAAAPPFFAGYTGFWRRLENVLAKKGSGVRKEDIYRVLSTSLLHAAFQVMLAPVRARMLLEIVTERKNEWRMTVRRIFSCVIFSGAVAVLSLLTRGRVTFCTAFWAILYFLTPIILRIVGKVYFSDKGKKYNCKKQSFRR